MASLSNINGKFVVEQTTGYVGVGTTDPNFLIEAAGANSEIALNSTSASIYRLRSTSSDSFIITKNGVGDRLTINGGGDATFAGTLQSGNFAIGAAPSSFGSGVPTITLQGTSANGRGGAIVFKEQDGTVTTNIYSTDGSDGYGTVINAAQGSFRVSVGALAANKLEINSSGNATFAGRIDIDGSPVATGDTRAVLSIDENNSASAGRGGGLTFGRQGNVYGGIKTLQNTSSNDNATMYFQTISGGTVSNRMVIDESGNVGIGTDDPDAYNLGSTGKTLAINSTSASVGSLLNMETAGVKRGYLFANASNVVLSAVHTGIPLKFNTEDTTALTIDSDQNSTFTGNVTVGTTAASDFVLALRGGVGGFFGWDDSANKTILQAPNTRQLSLRVNSDTFGAGTEAILIDSSGNVGIANSNPSGNAVGENGKSFIVGNESATAESASISIISGSGGYSYLLFGDGDGFAGYQGQVRYQHSSNNLQFVTGAAEKMRIRSTGSLVGTHESSAGIVTGLQLVNPINAAGTGHGTSILLHCTDGDPNRGVKIASSSTSNYAIDNDMLFYTSAGSTLTEKMRITSGGHILLGNTTASLTSDPGFKYIDDANVPYFGEVVNTSTGNGYSSFHHYNTNATFNGFRFYILNNGGIVNYSSNNVNLSDERVKNNIEDSGNYLDKICSIPVRLFNYKDEPEGTDKNLGVIAQEVEAIAPELVNNDGFGETPEDGIELKTVYSTDMMYALMKSIQELKAEIEILKNK